MDRSFLANDSVIAASRDFVCIRLATYEDSAEAEFLRTVYIGQSGDLENTVFVLLSPDTRTNLCRPGRGPQFAFRTPAALAAGMQEIATKYPAKSRGEDSGLRLPQMKDFRLGLNVSSCDGLPMVVCVADQLEQIRELSDRVAELAFQPQLAGKFAYASAASPEVAKVIDGYESESGYLLIQPGDYGMDGRLVKAFPANVGLDELESSLVQFANQTEQVRKDHNRHVRSGMQNGQSWETEIPVTDAMALRAQQSRENRTNSDRGPRDR